MVLPSILNNTLNISIAKTTNVSTAAITAHANAGNGYVGIVEIIAVVFIAWLVQRLIRDYLKRPKLPKLRPASKIMKSHLDANNKFGGIHPSNAVLELGPNERYKITYLDTEYKITPVKIRKDPKTKKDTLSTDLKAKPLEGLYIRAKPLDPIRQIFSQLVKDQIFIGAAKDFKIEKDKLGNIVSITAKKTMYFDVHGAIHYDREYPEIRYKLTQDTIYKEHWESQESSYDRASRIAVMINSPYMAGQAQLNKEQYEGQEKVEKAKRRRDYE